MYKPLAYMGCMCSSFPLPQMLKMILKLLDLIEFASLARY